ncbi:glycosyltransferase family 2 protein [Aurantiacibacter rhizosphaerae]|uniref:Glycosyltransferase n=1 Tax=Aurantiacibacter rhizosphaerae TaxID=2691582 RepID=A0A844X9F9_9SPHN|nr:glycosyltransferase [Aurantiacibacter rhizosphaerae]MWV26977.1 glycosyltransferase [Aurantiacibacter rhizosphaerae]
MMPAPQVSIIVPCYNGVPWLERLAQTLAPYRVEGVEIIFVDDGSTDDSAAAFQNFIPEAHILQQKNAGVAAARNAGASVALGQYLQFLDADDVILPGKFDAQISAASARELDVVYSDWRMVVVDSERIEYEPLRNKPMSSEPVAALLLGWWVPQHAYLIRKSAYDAIGGSNSKLVNAQDFDLVLRLAIEGKKFGHVPGLFAEYFRFVQAKSLAQGPRKQYWSDYETAVLDAVNIMEANDGLTLERRKAAAEKLHVIARSVYAIDKEWFSRLLCHLDALCPDYKPSGGGAYAAFGRVAGLRAAEAFAHGTRALRHRLRGAL